MPQTTELLTTKQVAELLGVDVDTVHRRASKGELPFVHKLPGRTGAYLFDPKVVNEVVA
jgi:excisionase family DNA binding protein